MGGNKDVDANVRTHMEELLKNEGSLKDADRPTHPPLPAIDGLLPHHSDNHQGRHTTQVYRLIATLLIIYVYK